MKREFLKGLGISDEDIEKIMKEHGLSIESEKAKTKLASEQLNAANEKIKSFENLDIDKIKEESSDWQKKAEKFEMQLKEESYKNAAKTLLNDYEFTSSLAKEAVLGKIIAKEFEVKDGNLVGADEFLKELKETNKEAFKDVSEPGGTGTAGGKRANLPPKNEGKEESIATQLGKAQAEISKASAENPYF